MLSPAISTSNLGEAILVAVRMRTPGHETGFAATVVDILINWNDVDVLQSDVDAYLGIAVPEEVGLLLDIRHIVGRFEILCVVQVFEEKILRMFDA